MNISISLDPNQEAAADALDGQTLVVACPGSGKTTVIIEHVHRLAERGIPHQNLLVITFTKAAAEEMQKRYETAFGTSGILFGTIHSVCFRVLRKAMGLCADSILREAEQWDFFRQYLYRRVQKTDLEEYIRQLLTEISYVKNGQLDPVRYNPSVCSSENFVQFLGAYEDFKQKHGKIDFDDMLILCRACLLERPEELAFWKRQFRYIMIDEFQDTNRIQADIFYMLAGENGNLFVVGDDDQSIYGFRSADSSIMLDFKKTYPACREYFLSTNYRSLEKIVNGASRLISYNEVRFKKDFRASRHGEGETSCAAFTDSLTQARSVVATIRRLHGSFSVPYNEIAVLYRTNVQNQILVGQLIAQKEDEIPFYTTERPRDYHNEFIFGDLMAYWRLAEGTWKNGDLQRILNRPSRYLKAEVFKDCLFDLRALMERCSTIEDRNRADRARSQIFDMCYHIKELKGKAPADFIKYCVNSIGYKRWLKDYADFTGKNLDDLYAVLQMLTDEASQFSTMQDWEAYAKFYAQKLEDMRRDRKRDGVCLSTFHSAKGLEWKAVIVIDCNEEVCPYKKAETPEEFEEERRLFYVGATRAKDILLFFYVKEREGMDLSPSRYLSEFGVLGDVPRRARDPKKDSAAAGTAKIGRPKAVPADPAVGTKQGPPLPAVKLTKKGQAHVQGLLGGASFI